MSNEPMRLENWSIFGKVAYGNVFNNPRFEDGTYVHTSTIQSRDGNVIKTLNSTYVLGKPDEQR
jgi:hypothetical protein